MSPDAKSLLDAALQLPESQRAEVAASLIESLDDGFDEDAEVAWQAEADRRLDDMLSGRAKGVSWSEARRRILGQQDGNAAA